MAAEDHEFLKNESDLFLREPLESGDRVEAACEMKFSAQSILRANEISAVVLAKAGTHTAESIGSAHLIDDHADDVGRW